MSNNKKIEAILWDCDGAIVNSLPIMRECWKNVQEKVECTRNIPFEMYKANIGRPILEILSRMGITDDKVAKEIESVYFSSESRKKVPEVYPGIIEVLDKLKDKYRLALVTSKDMATTKSWLEQLGVLGHFQDIQTPDGLPKEFGKPNPYYILKALANLKVAPNRALYLGDMEVDYEASVRAGTAFAHTSWGYGIIDNLHPTSNLKNPNEIFNYLKFLDGN